MRCIVCGGWVVEEIVVCRKCGYAPSKEHIAILCAKLQSQWTPAQEESRRAYKNKQAEIETYRIVKSGRGVSDV